ncbi:S-adenosyl-L-methionine-dependent methyltransferase [Obba rivulosa]|uniref:S-adenosyl-L-methionine-dependent methyltransferase n=1 Tax=Obba rivulosa TaxID=1052685 RepID=A0A8E2AZE7_9APHY|nr:S-adenosyl-L-methionine-dependent methyltransferase [Obba rivulosa]
MDPKPIGTPAQEAVRKFIAENQEGGWDKAWQEKVTPWDVGRPQPPLQDLVGSNEVELPKTGRALVPGCGSGHDAVLIASKLGLDVLAIDIAPTAVEAAQKVLESSHIPPPGKVHFQLQDFFAFTVPEGEKFDLVYDYTFFVAIPPSRRAEWGRQMAALLRSGGILVTLVFPIDPPQEVGPPFFVRPEHYVDVLGEGWEKILDKVPEHSLESHIGRERLLVWKKL